ncbi:MAG: phosphatase PAP2 family protein [Agathobacter sp.]|nr:phosphatase PAP2 family protein [Agathobacter sp.]
MNLEFDILYAIQNMHNPILDKIMVTISSLGNAGILWVVIALILLISKKHRKMGIHMFIAMLLTLFVGNLILKNLVQRERPCWIETTIPLLINNPKDYSFPSGHTMNSFTAAMCIFLHQKRWGIVAFVVAALIAFSRMYLFVHFPTDIIIGMIIGISSALIINFLMNKQNRFIS